MVFLAVTDWGDTIRTSLTNALSLLLEGVPKLIAFLLILIVGWLIAAAVARAVSAILHKLKFNDLAQRAGIAGFVRDMGVDTDSAGVLAGIVKWFIRLIFLVAAFDALGLPAVSAVLQQFLLWIPNLVVALVVLVIGGLLANALAHIVRGATAEAGLGNPDLLANVARIAVLVFAVVVAVNQIGIATTLVNTLFTGFVFAVALALGLSFGLGGRDTAAQIVQNWYTRGRQATPQIGQAASAMGQQAQQQVDRTRTATSTPSASRPASDDSRRG